MDCFKRLECNWKKKVSDYFRKMATPRGYTLLATRLIFHEESASVMRSKTRLTVFDSLDNGSNYSEPEQKFSHEKTKKPSVRRPKIKSAVFGGCLCF